MEVTEHNMTPWELTLEEVNSLIFLTKKHIRENQGDSVTQTYYATILGKLLILRHDCATSEIGTEETTITDL
jgi:hypothetical protein